ncbi:MAG: hypothetical protein JNL82_19040 [Myxococcales bacterium]|nr:hypothetical protein [Myxococcales bacterium]
MAFDRDTLESIFDATCGACHRCHRPLELSRYGQHREPGAWEIEPTRPHPKSTVLLAACVACLRPAAPPPRRERPAGLSLGAAPPPPARIGYAGRPRVSQ